MWSLSPAPKIASLLESELEIYGSNASCSILLGISLHNESCIDQYSDLSLSLSRQLELKQTNLFQPSKWNFKIEIQLCKRLWIAWISQMQSIKESPCLVREVREVKGKTGLSPNGSKTTHLFFLFCLSHSAYIQHFVWALSMYSMSRTELIHGDLPARRNQWALLAHTAQCVQTSSPCNNWEWLKDFQALDHDNVPAQLLGGWKHKQTLLSTRED